MADAIALPYLHWVNKLTTLKPKIEWMTLLKLKNY